MTMAHNKYAKPVLARDMSAVEQAWVGAFVEADGSILKSYPKGCAGCWRIIVYQKEVEPISALLRATGVGSVTLARGRLWSWQVDRFVDVLHIAQQCAPYSEKAQRFVEWEQWNRPS